MALLSFKGHRVNIFSCFIETTKTFPQSRPDPRPDPLPGLPARTPWGAWRCYLCSDGLLFELIQSTGIHNLRDESSSSLHTRNLCTYTALPRTRGKPTCYAPKHAQLLTTPAHAQLHIYVRLEGVLSRLVLPARGATSNSYTSSSNLVVCD